LDTNTLAVPKLPAGGLLIAMTEFFSRLLVLPQALKNRKSAKGKVNGLIGVFMRNHAPVHSFGWAMLTLFGLWSMAV
jgi:hypothetical protein